MSQIIAERYRKVVVKVKCKDLKIKGSGFFIDNNIILTNNHVVSIPITDNKGVISLFYSRDIYVEIDGLDYPATLLINEESDKPFVYDYAILKVISPNTMKIELGDYSKVSQGEKVLALGFPSNFDSPIVTSGIISAILSRQSHRNALHVMQTFLTDTLISYGSSGGPLIRESDGKVIGIATMPHKISGELKDKLEKYSISDSNEVTSPIRDLIKYVLHFVQVGYNYAISIKYALSDEALAYRGDK